MGLYARNLLLVKCSTLTCFIRQLAFHKVRMWLRSSSLNAFLFIFI